MLIDAPKFRISARAIDVLKTPDEFYSQLTASIQAAKTRIFLATLYIGAKEYELVDTIYSQLEKNKQLKVHILSDGLRGTREYPKGESTASLLTPLVADFPERVIVSMYQTPAYRGMAKLLPKRFNEGCGLQHMKLYGVDDEIILSGANLSHDYFTNRQDRYIRIRDKHVTNYFWNVFEGVSDLSYIVRPTGRHGPANFELSWPHSWPRDQMIHRSKERLQKLLEPQQDVGPEQDTVVYPLLQLTPFGLGNELGAMKQLCASGFPWTLTAGYFNIATDLKRELFKARAEGQVIIASPEANGFFGSKGLSSNVPGLYSMLAQKFAAEAAAEGAPIDVAEWNNGVHNQVGGRSYHAKGLWLRPAVGHPPFATVIGSSNFTKRAYTHDLEAGALITTTDEALQHTLQAEVDHLMAHTRPMTSYPVKAIHRAFVSVFGDRL